MPFFLPRRYTACQTGATSKGRAVDRKVAVGMCGKSDARGRNPPVSISENLPPSQIWFGTCINMLLAARGGAHPLFVNTLNLHCGWNHITRCSAPSKPAITTLKKVFVLGIVVAYLFSCFPLRTVYSFKTMCLYFSSSFFFAFYVKPC